MNTDITIKHTEQSPKVWSIGQISFATYFAGPLAGCYLLNQNFKLLGDTTSAKRSLVTGVIATILLICFIGLLPEEIFDKIPQMLIPISYTAVITGFTEWKQKQKILSLIESGTERYSHIKAFGMSLLFLLIQLPLFFGFAYLLIVGSQ